MTTPHFDDVRAIPLTTDADLIARVEHLLRRALRRQLWLMFLDENDLQSQTVIPIDELPDRPDSQSPFGHGLATVMEGLEVRTLVAVLERPGGELLTDDDHAWATHLRDECGRAGVPFRGPILCHSRGVRRMEPDLEARS
jgi:hypothetical protein